MVEPTGHCPYLGLKQNRAIRFASPTPEHRCYVSGEPLEIPVDQSSYCLSQGHVHCPLYMGLTVPTISDTAPTLAGGALIVPAGGMRGWLNSLSRRDRAIYAIMIAMLAIIVAIYLLVGLQALFRRNNQPAIGTQPTASAGLEQASPLAATQPSLSAPTSIANPTATAEAPTPTDLPTNVPTATPTTKPTMAPVILQ